MNSRPIDRQKEVMQGLGKEPGRIGFMLSWPFRRKKDIGQAGMTEKNKEDNIVRKIISLFAVAVLVLLLTCPIILNPESAYAEDVIVLENPPAPGWAITSPMETGGVGFWFPDTGAFAAGLSHTALRVQYLGATALLDRISLDIDATIAQEITENNETDDKDTLIGIGAKLNFNVAEIAPGLKFLPSIGLTALNNFDSFKTVQDILDNYELAVYGTVLLYKW